MNPPPPSFTAISASIDRDCTAYTGVASAQRGMEELISDITPMMQEVLNRYRAKHDGKLPESIIYWRDGVSEGEFRKILDVELSALKRTMLAKCIQTALSLT